MGILISRFRKKRTTIEVLEDLDKQIKEIEQYGQNTEQRHKRIVGILILYSVALYTITAIVFYFYFFPASLYDQLFYIIPLLMFPLLILFTKKMVTWYYKRKISRNQEKLDSMKKQKSQILEEVTETETYKKAKEILMKFAPDQLKSPVTPHSARTPSFSSSVAPIGTLQQNDTPRRAITPSVPAISNVSDGSVLRRRALTASTAAQNSQLGKISTVAGALPTASAYPVISYPPSTPHQITNKQFGSPSNPLPRPILPQQRSYIDKLVEYLVGDGPSNRYALICRQCESHNGMALKEEFEYFAFRCCYCNFWNPARKQKPSAPKLELDQSTTNHQFSASLMELPSTKSMEPKIPTSKSDNSINLSESDSDIEVVEKPNENEDENDEQSSQKSDEDGTKPPENIELKTSEDKMEVDEPSTN